MKILVLDDDPLVVEGLVRALNFEGYQCLTAHSAAEAVRLASEELLDLVISDVRMPEVDGLQALAMLSSLQKGVRSIVLTGYASEDSPVRAIKQGVDDYLFKPVSIKDLLRSVRHSLQLCQFERSQRQTLESVRQSYLELVIALVSMVQNRDPHFADHSRRVAGLAVNLGLELGLEPGRLDRLELVAWLHDLGTLDIEQELLNRVGQLSEDELARLRLHPQTAAAVLEKVPDLREIAPIMRAVREHYDGSGVPQGLSGDQIPFEARILAVAEALDSLTHARSHRPARSLEEALSHLRDQSGRLYDPEVVSSCCDLAYLQRELADPSRLLFREREALGARHKLSRLLELANVFRQSGQLESAELALGQAEKLLPEVGPDLQAELLIDRAELALAAGAEPDALRWLGQARGCLGSAVERAPLLERMARVLTTLRRPNQAVSLVREALELVRDREPWMECRLNGLLARLAMLAPEGEKVFRELFATWAASHFPGYLESLPPLGRQEAVELYLEAHRRGLPEPEAREALGRLTADSPALSRRVAEVLPSFGATASQPPELHEAPPPPSGLQIQLLGKLRLLFDERAVAENAWCARKAQELLAYLLVSGKPVPMERLMETLWPDGASREQLHTAVYRVRQALKSVGFSQRWLQSERNFYLLSPEIEYWLDLREFERLSSGLAPGSAPGDLARLQQALSLYAGDFLEGFSEGWVLETRSRLRAQWLHLMRILAQHWEGQRNWSRAGETYRGMLEQDLCLEEAHFGIMRCHAQMGQRDQAVRAYQEYCQVLESELGLEPSPEVTAFCQSLSG